MCRAGRPDRKSKFIERKDSKAVEVRWCDSIDDIKEYIPKLKREYNM